MKKKYLLTALLASFTLLPLIGGCTPAKKQTYPTPKQVSDKTSIKVTSIDNNYTEVSKLGVLYYEYKVEITNTSRYYVSDYKLSIYSYTEDTVDKMSKFYDTNIYRKDEDGNFKTLIAPSEVETAYIYTNEITNINKDNIRVLSYHYSSSISNIEVVSFDYVDEEIRYDQERNYTYTYNVKVDFPNPDSSFYWTAIANFKYDGKRYSILADEFTDCSSKECNFTFRSAVKLDPSLLQLQKPVILGFKYNEKSNNGGALAALVAFFDGILILAVITEGIFVFLAVNTIFGLIFLAIFLPIMISKRRKRRREKLNNPERK